MTFAMADVRCVGLGMWAPLPAAPMAPVGLAAPLRAGGLAEWQVSADAAAAAATTAANKWRVFPGALAPTKQENLTMPCKQRCRLRNAKLPLPHLVAVTKDAGLQNARQGAQRLLEVPDSDTDVSSSAGISTDVDSDAHMEDDMIEAFRSRIGHLERRIHLEREQIVQFGNLIEANRKNEKALAAQISAMKDDEHQQPAASCSRSAGKPRSPRKVTFAASPHEVDELEQQDIFEEPLPSAQIVLPAFAGRSAWEWDWEDEDQNGEQAEHKEMGFVDGRERVEEERDEEEKEEEEIQDGLEEWEQQDNLEKLFGAMDSRLESNLSNEGSSAGASVPGRKNDPQAAEGSSASPSKASFQSPDAVVGDPETRYHGVVKHFRGSFGWIACTEVARKYCGSDVFLHKLDCNTIPRHGDRLSFCLTRDDKGNPKAVKAVIAHVDVPTPSAPSSSVVAPGMSGRDWFDTRRGSCLNAARD